MSKAALEKSALFCGFTEEERAKALAFFDAKEQAYNKGDTVKPIHSPFTRFGLVLEGQVQVYADDISGNQMMMAHVEKGHMFGESLSYLKREEPVYAMAASPCRILWLHPGKVQALSAQTPLEQTLIRRFIESLAHRALNMNDRIQILSKLTLEEKLKAYFTLCRQRQGNPFRIPFSRTELATYLGANRSALSRVLSGMEKQGYLSCDGRSFTLHIPWEE